jgi:ElaA protein
MDWKCYEFNQMTTRELYEVLRMRITVFVVEYAHIHLDLDYRDAEALHVVALERGGTALQVAAYARLVPGDDQDPEVTIDRILTRAERRNDDTHDLLIAHALAAAHAMGAGCPIHVNAPVHHEARYEGFGFRKIAGPYLEHGIPHVAMAWRPSVLGRHAASVMHAVQWISPPATPPGAPGR